MLKMFVQMSHILLSKKVPLPTSPSLYFRKFFVLLFTTFFRNFKWFFIFEFLSPYTPLMPYTIYFWLFLLLFMSTTGSREIFSAGSETAACSFHCDNNTSQCTLTTQAEFLFFKKFSSDSRTLHMYVYNLPFWGDGKKGNRLP